MVRLDHRIVLEGIRKGYPISYTTQKTMAKILRITLWVCYFLHRDLSSGSLRIK